MPTYPTSYPAKPDESSILILTVDTENYRIKESLEEQIKTVITVLTLKACEVQRMRVD